MKIKIRYSFILYIIILHFFDLLGYFLIFFLSIMIHELIHSLVGISFGLNIKSMEISLNGLNIDFKKFQLKTSKKILVLLSGPLSNLAILIFFYFLNKEKYIFIIISNMLLFIFNMIPIYPLDGGRILYEILLKYFRFSIANNILINVYKFFSIITLLLVSYMYINFYNTQVLFIGLYILGFYRYNTQKNIIII